MATILVHGITTLVGSYIAADWLHMSGQKLVYTDEITEDYATSLILGAADHAERQLPSMTRRYGPG